MGPRSSDGTPKRSAGWWTPRRRPEGRLPSRLRPLPQCAGRVPRGRTVPGRGSTRKVHHVAGELHVRELEIALGRAPEAAPLIHPRDAARALADVQADGIDLPFGGTLLGSIEQGLREPPAMQGGVGGEVAKRS